MPTKLPDRWEICTLGEVCVVSPHRKEIATLNDDMDVSFVPMAAVSEDGRLLDSKTTKVREVKEGFPHFKEHDVLVAKITPCFENGKRWFAKSLINGIGFGSTEFHVLRANRSRVLPEWIYYIVSLPEFRRDGQRRMTGTAGQKRVPSSFLEEYRIPVPSLTIQRRVVALLERLDAAKDLRNRSGQLAREFLNAVFFDMFGDPLTNPKRWEMKQIRQLGKVITGNTPSRRVPAYYGSYIEWIKSDNLGTPSTIVSQSKEGLSKKGAEIGGVAPKGSVLVTCIAGSLSSIGSAAIADRDVAFNQQINAVVPNKNVESHFLYHLLTLSRKKIQGSSTKAMKKMISKTSFEKISLIFPPPELQKRFGAIAEKYQSVIIDQLTSKELIQGLFNAKLHDLGIGDYQ
jgi:type I restriction enzyme S subunit